MSDRDTTRGTQTERLSQAMDAARAAARSVVEVEGLPTPDEIKVGKIVAVQVPFAEWTELLAAAAEWRPVDE